MPIICRSSWEEAFCRWCDNDPRIVQWSSEEISIKYPDPIQRIDRQGRPKFKTYYPDFLLKNDRGQVFLIEVKPAKETVPPRKSKRKSQKTVLTEEKTWLINQAKWKAANAYCSKAGWTFKIITEKELFGR